MLTNGWQISIQAALSFAIPCLPVESSAIFNITSLNKHRFNGLSYSHCKSYNCRCDKFCSHKTFKPRICFSKQLYEARFQVQQLREFSNVFCGFYCLWDVTVNKQRTKNIYHSHKSVNHFKRKFYFKIISHFTFPQKALFLQSIWLFQ